MYRSITQGTGDFAPISRRDSGSVHTHPELIDLTIDRAVRRRSLASVGRSIGPTSEGTFLLAHHRRRHRRRRPFRSHTPRRIFEHMPYINPHMPTNPFTGLYLGRKHGPPSPDSITTNFQPPGSPSLHARTEQADGRSITPALSTAGQHILCGSTYRSARIR